MEPAPFQRRDAVNRTVCLSLRDHKVLQYCSWVKGSVRFTSSSRPCSLLVGSMPSWPMSDLDPDFG